MIGGLFSKGSSGHSVRTIGSVHRGKSVGVQIMDMLEE